MGLARTLLQRIPKCSCEKNKQPNYGDSETMERSLPKNLTLHDVIKTNFTPTRPCLCSLPVLYSYDCNCQYIVKLPERFAKSAPELLDRLMAMRFSVPVVHLRDHKELCEYIFGTYYMPGSAHFYGEQAESIWAVFNQLGGRTRQMKKGHRHDTINEHYGDWNWRKICLLCKRKLVMNV